MITMRIIDKTAACTKQEQIQIKIFSIEKYCIMEFHFHMLQMLFLKGMMEYLSLHLIVAQNTAIITIVSLIFRCLFVDFIWISGTVRIHFTGKTY